MKEERMAVLSMLEKGVINVEEAERLLKLFQEEPARPHRRPHPERRDDFDFGETADKVSKKLSGFARRMGDKMEDAATVMEPKIRKAAQNVADKTQDAAWTVADKTQDVVMDLKKSYDERKADKKDTRTPRGDEPVCDEDFEDTVEGTIVGVEDAPEAEKPADACQAVKPEESTEAEKPAEACPFEKPEAPAEPEKPAE